MTNGNELLLLDIDVQTSGQYNFHERSFLFLFFIIRIDVNTYMTDRSPTHKTLFCLKFSNRH